MNVHPSMTLLELQSIILQKLRRQNNKQITQVLHKLLIVIRKDIIGYKSLEISSDEDASMMFDYRIQFPDIRIMELFFVVEDLALSSRGFAPDLASVAMSLPECSPTFTMASPMQNENVWTENTNDLMGEPSFAQLAMEIAAPFPLDGPIVGFDFIVDHGDDEDEAVEAPGDSNNGEDGEAVLATQSQPWSNQSQF